MERLTSLDAFRGATVASMILVNNPGSGSQVYEQLEHATWDGWTFTDMVFPSFLWMVGVSMTLSFAKRLAQGHSRGKLMLHAVRRTALIIVVSLLLGQFPYFRFEYVRYPGVLQRIAVCYAIAAAIYLYLGIRGVMASVVVLLAAYWMLMTLYPVPGFGPGVMTVQGNFARYFDGMFLSGHMWRHTRDWDPEGIVSTLPAIVSTLFGILTGAFLKQPRPQSERTSWLFVSAIALVLVGALMNIWMPINKSLWTDSFALFMAGVSTAAFTIFYWFIDVQGHKRWAKWFVIYGSNALAAYVLSGMIARLAEVIRIGNVPLQAWLYRNVLLSIAAPRPASVLYALLNVLVVFLFSYLLYRRKWLIRL